MLSETEMAEMVTVNVAKILKAQGAPDGQAKWGTKEHNTLLMLTAKDCGMDADCAKEFVAFLPIAGIEGNSALIPAVEIPERENSADDDDGAEVLSIYDLRKRTLKT